MELQQTLPEKVREGLARCNADISCIGCPYYDNSEDPSCINTLMSDSLYLINYLMGETQK